MRHISTIDKPELADLFELLANAPPPTPAEIEAREAFAAAWRFYAAMEAEEPSEASTTGANGGF